MKRRILCSLLGCIVVVSLTGCGTGAPSIETKSTESTSETEILLNETNSTQTKETETDSAEMEETNKSTGSGSVYSGGYTTAIIDAQGNLLICGDNENGQLGDEIPSQKSTYSLVASDIKSVYGTFSFAAISNSNILYTWGYNAENQLGPNRNYDMNTELVEVDSDVYDMAITSTVCAYVTYSGELFAMGSPRSKLGDEAGTMYSDTPVKIMDNVANVELSTNSEHGITFAALTLNNELYMWGANSEGMIAPDGENDIDKPIKVMENIKDISFGRDFVLILTVDNELYAWGKNSWGQLGIGNTDETDEVVKVMDDISCIDAGTSASLAITEAGELYTWGCDTRGNLGQGIDSEGRVIVEEPKKIMDNIKSASMDKSTMIILTQDGDVFTCGNNESGQLGTGDTEERNVPEWVYNIYESEIPGKLSDENVGVVTEEYFDEMDATPVTIEGSGENLTVNMTVDHLSDFIKYNGGKISLRLSDGEIALMFRYEVEDDMAASENSIYVLTDGSWSGAGWSGITCEQNEDILSWNIILPSGSFTTENIKYIEADIYTSRSRSHKTTYEIQGVELVPIETRIEHMDVAVPSGGEYHKYIE